MTRSVLWRRVCCVPRIAVTVLSLVPILQHKWSLFTAQTPKKPLIAGTLAEQPLRAWNDDAIVPSVRLDRPGRDAAHAESDRCCRYTPVGGGTSFLLCPRPIHSNPLEKEPRRTLNEPYAHVGCPSSVRRHRRPDLPSRPPVAASLPCQGPAAELPPARHLVGRSSRRNAPVSPFVLRLGANSARIAFLTVIGESGAIGPFMSKNARHHPLASQTSPHCPARNIARPQGRVLLGPHSPTTAFESRG